MSNGGNEVHADFDETEMVARDEGPGRDMLDSESLAMEDTMKAALPKLSSMEN